MLRSRLRPAIVLAGLLAGVAAWPAAAIDFQPAKGALYVGWPALEGEGFPQGGEPVVYAIVNKSAAKARAVYVVMFDNGRVLSPVGTMACSVGFEVLGGQHNGWHDIACENPGRSDTWVMGADGSYHAR